MGFEVGDKVRIANSCHHAYGWEGDIIKVVHIAEGWTIQLVSCAEQEKPMWLASWELETVPNYCLEDWEQLLSENKEVV